MMRVRDRKKLMNALTVDPLYLQHAQSGRLTSLLGFTSLNSYLSIFIFLHSCTKHSRSIYV